MLRKIQSNLEFFITFIFIILMMLPNEAEIENKKKMKA